MNRPQRTAFALLLTLLLVVLIAAVLAGTARWSMLTALDAREATEDVQRRWALASCQATLLPRMPALLARTEKAVNTSQRQPFVPAQVRVACTLGGMQVDLLLTDEQAKLNANTLLTRDVSEDAEIVLRRLLASPGEHVRVRLTPTGSGTSLLPRIGSHNQWAADATVCELFGWDGTTSAAQDVTCWGDGRINIHRASRAVIQEVCGPVLTRKQTESWIKLRDEEPDRPLTEMLSRFAAIDDAARAKLSTAFCDESHCFGLALAMRGSVRSWYTQTVVETAGTADGSKAAESDDVTILRRFDFVWSK